MIRLGPACLAMLLASTLGGCGTVLDPSPYDPNVDRAVLDTNNPPYTSATVLTFTNESDAAKKLLAMSDGFASQRNSLMRQELLFDIPIIGLAAAAIINPLFKGAKNATLGLGLGAAGAGGARLYFNPPIKISAYNAAALSLRCAASVAGQMELERETDEVSGRSLVAAMQADIAAAAPLASSNSALLAARDQAVKSLATLQAALAILDGFTTALQTFAINAIDSATNKVVTGVQNVTAVQQLISGAAKPPSTGPAAAAPPLPLRTVPELTTTLQNESTNADAITQRINSASSALQKCTS